MSVSIKRSKCEREVKEVINIKIQIRKLTWVNIIASKYNKCMKIIINKRNTNT